MPIKSPCRRRLRPGPVSHCESLWRVQMHHNHRTHRCFKKICVHAVNALSFTPSHTISARPSPSTSASLTLAFALYVNLFNNLSRCFEYVPSPFDRNGWHTKVNLFDQRSAHGIISYNIHFPITLISPCPLIRIASKTAQWRFCEGPRLCCLRHNNEYYSLIVVSNRSLLSHLCKPCPAVYRIIIIGQNILPCQLTLGCMLRLLREVE